MCIPFHMKIEEAISSVSALGYTVSINRSLLNERGSQGLIITIRFVSFYSKEVPNETQKVTETQHDLDKDKCTLLPQTKERSDTVKDTKNNTKNWNPKEG